MAHPGLMQNRFLEGRPRMKHKWLTDSQSAFDDSNFSLGDDQVSASFVPSLQPTSMAVTAPSEVLLATTPSDAGDAPIPDAIILPIPVPYTSVKITSGGITINLLFDAAAMSAPESFREGIEQAATLLASAITNNITVNLTIDYSGTGRGAGARPDDVHSLPYLRVAGLLAFNGVDTHDFWSLPNTPSIQGLDPDTGTIKSEANVDVYNAQEKVWGLLGANDTTTDDGRAIFATDIDPTLLAGVALHELTHALGRAPVIAATFEAPNDPTPNVFDLFRFTSPGVRLFQSYNGFDVALPAYFSVDGGNTKLADYDQFSDPSDFKDDGVQGSTDPFDAHYMSDTSQLLTAVDLEQLTVLGFHVSSGLPLSLIDISGSTRLDRVGRYYYLDPINGGAESGPLLKFNGAPVYQGEFPSSSGTWSPIGAEQTATGYEIAWRIAGTDIYTLWNTDTKGNFLSHGGNGGDMSGTSRDLELAEARFQQDLNGDGTIGLKTTVIEAIGSTKLDQVANNYFLDPVGGGQGPSLKYQGVDVVTGQFSSPPGVWSPIAAEKTANGGYDIAWKIVGTDIFTIWSTDANGNYIANIIPDASGSSSWDIASIETTFKQDLNGDGIIGLLNIEAFGSTKLDKLGNTYFLDPVSGGKGPTLNLSGSPSVTGWIAVGAEKTASGYQVVWNVPGLDTFEVWNVDNNGNFISFSAPFGYSASLQSLESVFQQDLNGDGAIGIVPKVTIDNFGSTILYQQGIHYYVTDSFGLGHLLSDAGTPVVPGRYGTWTPIAAEATATGFDVAWKDSATGNFRVWATDGNANHTSTILDNVAATNTSLEALETTFKQDLNGDGHIGLVTAIDASGSTRLDLFGNHYFLDPAAGGSGPVLKVSGTPLAPGSLFGMNAIGAEQTATGYEVAFKAPSADQYSVWKTDSSGNLLSFTLNSVSGTSLALELAETRFHQDLNGDGLIGPLNNVEVSGATRLDVYGNNYFLDTVSGGAGPSLKYQGAAVVVGQFGSWTPIGAEQTANGYEVALKVNGSDQYLIWNTDNNGNYVSDTGGLSRTSIVLEASEVSFHQDLNGDGIIGVPATVVEAFGSTSLGLAGNTYSLDPVGGGQGPTLKYQGAAVVPGEFGSWTLIGAEQTASGYDAAWKVPGADQYIIWNTDSNGNYVSQSEALSGTSIVLEASEVSLHQDLNGDGIIGVAPTVVEAFGSTRLDLAGNTYSLDPVSGGQGPTLKYQGAAVVPGQFGSWTVIGAEHTASGYEVAWKVNGDDQYLIWNTDGNGNYVSQGSALSGASSALKTAETSFHQDLNGDGVIGVPPPSGPDGGPDGVPPASGPAGDSFVFRPDLGTNSVIQSANLNTPDPHNQPLGPLPEFSSSGPDAALEMLIQHDPHDLPGSQDQLTSSLHIADLHAGGVLIH